MFKRPLFVLRESKYRSYKDDLSGNDLFYDATVNIGQAFISALMKIGKQFVINTK